MHETCERRRCVSIGIHSDRVAGGRYCDADLDRDDGASGGLRVHSGAVEGGCSAGAIGVVRCSRSSHLRGKEKPECEARDPIFDR